MQLQLIHFYGQKLECVKITSSEGETQLRKKRRCRLIKICRPNFHLIILFLTPQAQREIKITFLTTKIKKVTIVLMWSLYSGLVFD